LALFTIAVTVVAISAQEPPKPAKDKDAIKLPDGTIVFYTKSPDDANPPVDGVRLTAKEYKSLVDQAEQLKKLKDGVKPASPSECHVTGRTATRGDRTVAELTLTYRFRTTGPRQTIALGGGRAFPLGAKIDGDALPVLVVADDGVTVLVEQPGDHTLVLTAEAAVTARGFTGALGFDLGLPRAAITSLSFAAPAPAGQRVTVGVRGADPTARPGELRRTTYDAARLAKDPVPIGAADLVEVTWDAAATGKGSASIARVAETDLGVRVDDTQVETTARVKLAGEATRTWEVVLPAGAEVTLERAGQGKAPESTGSQAVVAKPADSSGPGRWTVDLPDAGDWLLTTVVKTTRPGPGNPGHDGPFPIGPVVVRNVLRQSGTVRVVGPPNVRLGFTYGSELRRIDPAANEAAAFQFATVPVGPGETYPPLLTVRSTPAPGVVYLKPQYRFRLTPAGWRVHADLRVTPVRTGATHFRIEYPADWPPAEVGPPELVENAETDPTGRRITTVRLDAPRPDPIDLTLDVTIPLAAGARTATITFPQFLGTSVRESVVSVVVPTGFTVTGSARTNGDGAGTELLPSTEPVGKATSPPISAVVSGQASQVDLAWQPYRPPLSAEISADVVVQDRQYVVTETIDFKTADPPGHPLRLRGPAGAVGLRGQPTVSPAGSGEWTVVPPADRGKEWTLTLTYAVPVRPDAVAKVPVSLVWPEDATHTDAELRLWSGSDRRVAGFDGLWRETSPRPSAARDSLPALTLLASRGADDPPPSVAIQLGEPETAPTRAVIERALVQAWLSADGPGAGRARYVLSRWPTAGIDLDLPDQPVEIWLDGKRVENPAPIIPAEGYAAAVRVPMPEPRPGRTAVMVDVRFPLPSASVRWTALPPHVRSAAAKLPPRWQLTSLPGSVTLDFPGNLSTDIRWVWRGGRADPAPVGTAAEFDRWIADGTEPTEVSDVAGLTGRQLDPFKPVRLTIPSLWFWSAACSAAALLAGLAVARYKPPIGLAVVVIGGLIAAAYFTVPQPFTQFLAAAQPGVLAVGLILLGQAIVRGYYRRRLTNLPGFSRQPLDLPASVVESGSPAGSAAEPLNVAPASSQS
jgi:hypothetical protein